MSAAIQSIKKSSLQLWMVALAAANSTLLAMISLLGPLTTVIAIAGAGFLLLAALAQCGLIAMVAAVSHVAIVPGIDPELVGALKWGLFALFFWITTVRRLVERASFKFEWGSFEKAFIAFIVWSLFCSAVGFRPLGGIATVLKFAVYLLIYFIARETVTDTGSVRLLLYSVASVIVVTSCYNFFEVFQRGSIYRFHGFMVNANSFGLVLFGCMPFILIGMRSLHSRWERILFYLIFALFFVNLVLSFSRASWLGCFGIGVAYMAYEHRKALYRAAAIGSVVFLFLLTFEPVYEVFVTSTRLQFGITHRDVYWRFGLQAFADSPIVGHGFELKKKDIRGSQAITTYQEAMSFSDKENSYWAHNAYISMLVKTGLPGLLLSILVYVALFRERYAWRRTAATRSQRLVQTATIAMLIGALLNSFFEEGPMLGSSVFRTYFWLMLGLSAAVHKHDIDL